MDEMLAAGRLLLMSASPVACLAAGADHSQTRRRLLRNRSLQLAGAPVVTIPCSSAAWSWLLCVAQTKHCWRLQLGSARNEESQR